jgi:flagellar hook-associated protein 2
MSDFSIPGVGTSKYGTDQLIQGLMKVERVPRDRAADLLKSFQDQKGVWLDLNQRLSTLRDDARNLYSFRNPFLSRVAKSSNEDVLTATATREALEQTRSVLVKRAAAADRFLSADLPKDYKVPAGTYTFSVGDKTVDLGYGGGALQDFADSLTRKGRDMLRASVVAITPDTKALVIESLKAGALNRLGFKNDSEKLALDSGMLERVVVRARSFDPGKPASWEKALDPALAAVSNGTLAVLAGGEARLALDTPVKTQGLVLELKYRLVPLAVPPAPAPPPGPSLKPVGQTTYDGITIQGAASDTALPPWAAPSTPPRVEDTNMAFVVGSDGTYRALPALQDGSDVQTLTVDPAAYTQDLAAIGLRSRDTTRRLEVVSARVFDPTEMGGFRPKRPVSTAQDAALQVDGIDVTRPSNDVSDVIPGVTVNVKAASDKPVSLKIEPDRKAVKDAIIGLVGDYNRIMAQLNILTRDDESIINEITYFTDDEKKSARDHLGMLLNDSTLTMLRTSLQNTMMGSYDTGGDLRILAQAGISTNAQKAGAGQGYDAGKMRGYLEIDEDSLDKTLASSFDLVRNLFGYDDNGDLIIDSGVAYKMDSVIRPYVETAGIISLKSGNLDRQIKTEKDLLDTLDRQLAQKEADLKAKYATMEGTLNQMQSTSSSIDQFSKNNSGQ